jgi:hypothetical protein
MAAASSGDVLLRVRTLPRLSASADRGVMRALLCAPSQSMEDVLAAVCAPLVRAPALAVCVRACALRR